LRLCCGTVVTLGVSKEKWWDTLSIGRMNQRGAAVDFVDSKSTIYTTR
jgi:hypothetical protein